MDERSSSQAELSQRDLVARVAAAFGALFVDMRRTLAADVGACERDALAAWAVRGSRLADDLLAYAGAQPLAPEPLEPWPLLRALASDLRRALDARFEVVVRVADECPACIADREALRCTLLALVANARDAMPDGGLISLLAESARLADGSLAVELAVRDEGPGIAPAVHAAATEPLVTSKSGRTSGLGLAVAEGFARQSGGELRLASSPAGTVCRIVLPARGASRERS